MKFTYTVKAHTASRERKVSMDFTPYKNLISSLNFTEKSWETEGNVKVERDQFHPILIGSDSSQIVRAQVAEGDVTIKAKLPVEVGKSYYISLYIRANDATSAALRVDGKYIDAAMDSFTQTVGGTFTADKEEIELSIDFYEVVPINLAASKVAWIDGLFLTEIKEEELNQRKETLKEKYEYVEKEKLSPTPKDLLGKMFHFSPFRYYLAWEGRRLMEYTTPLIELGITEDSFLETGEAEREEQLFAAFIHDVPLMAMLEGRASHVSHAYPKEDKEMSRLHKSHFPRIQYFTGFAVNRTVSDTTPNSEEVNYAFNVYIPITKVMESVSAIMILNQASALMGELGWAKVRGSDYFLKNEQLYVLQTQFIQDQNTAMKRR